MSVRQVGSVTFDLNEFIDANNGIFPDENAAAYINVCNATSRTGRYLIARMNELTNTSGYRPTTYNLTGGYATGLWFDPVPTNYMDVSIQSNSGFFWGVCLREDDVPWNPNFLDPQAQVRSFALQDHNRYCHGTEFDIRMENGAAFDPTVQSAPIPYRGYFCNGECVHGTLVTTGAGSGGAWTLLPAWVRYRVGALF